MTSKARASRTKTEKAKPPPTPIEGPRDSSSQEKPREDEFVDLDITLAPELVALAGIEPSSLFDGSEPIILRYRRRPPEEMREDATKRTAAQVFFGMMARAMDERLKPRKKAKASRSGRSLTPKDRAKLKALAVARAKAKPKPKRR